MSDRSVITPTIAVHVLHHFDAGGIRAGSFTVRLIELIGHADPINRAKLGLVFPGYVDAVDLAQNEAGGIAELRHIGAAFGAASAPDQETPPPPPPPFIPGGLVR